MTWLRARFLTLDPRTLGLFRIYFGLLLLANLYERTQGLDLITFYTNEGIWPNHAALLNRPTDYWSLFITFSTPGEVRFAFALTAVVYALYTVGWMTRVVKWLVVVLVVSVNNRNLLPQHGGDCVLNMLAIWTAFMPVGDRFSVDSLLRSLGGVREKTTVELNARAHRSTLAAPAVSFAVFGMFVNFAAVYLFNAANKSGLDWHDGSAVHWVFWQNTLATGVAGWVRMHEPRFLSPMFTWGTLYTEWTLPVLLLTPVRRRYARLLALVCIWALHGSIAVFCTLGPFSYAMMAFGLLCLTTSHWDWLVLKLGATSPKRVVRLDPGRPTHLFAARLLARFDGLDRLHFEDAGPGGPWTVDGSGRTLAGAPALGAILSAFPLGRVPALLFRVPGAGRLLAWSAVRGVRLLAALPAARPPLVWPRIARSALARALDAAAAVVLISVVGDLYVQNAAKPAQRPQWMADVIYYLDIPQIWRMFSPVPPRSDRSLVVDATLEDGSHVDLLTGAPPDFEAPLHGPFHFNQAWCEVHRRMPRWQSHWPDIKAYLLRRPELLGWPPEKRHVVAMSVFEITAKAPPLGSTSPYDLEQQRLFGFPE